MRAAMPFFDHLVRCETRLYNAMTDRLGEEHGIGVGPFDFLRFLRDHPASRVSDLATAHAVGNGAASKAVDRYEREGWVIRSPHPTNRRSSIVTLTDSGRQLVDDAERTFRAELTDLLLTALTPAEVAAVADALATLRRSLEAANIGIPAG